MQASSSLAVLVVVADGDPAQIGHWQGRAVPFLDLAISSSVADAEMRLRHETIDAVMVDAHRGVTEVVAAVERLKLVGNGRPILMLIPDDSGEQAPSLASAAAEAGVGVVHDGGPVQLFRSLRQVVAECRRAEFARRQDRLEPVTGLPSRANFVGLVGSKLMTETSVAVLAIDVDAFNAVNDLVGREMGDRALVTLADRLLGALGDGDAIGCAGGGRFLVCTRVTMCPEEALVRVRMLLDVVARPLPAGGRRLQLTASAGVALFPQDASTVETLVARAEGAVYRAKALGPGSYRLFQPLLLGVAPGQLRKRAAVRRELDRDALELVFEPQLDLRTERPRAARLALRARADGAVLKFAADELDDLALPVSRWALEMAGTQMAQWLARDVPLVPLVIDVPLRLVHRSDMVEMVRSRLRSVGCHPAWFEISVRRDDAMPEITDAATAEHLQALRDLGLRVTLAGYGGRTSSFALLRHLPADGIELAAELVEGFRQRPVDGTILKALVELAQELGLEVGASGVDRTALARQLRDAGCDWASGPWVGAPIVAASFTEWLAADNTLMAAS